MKILAIALSIIFGVMGYRYIPIQVWIDMNQGLLAFLGLLAAAIIQVIPVTTNFIQSDTLTLVEAQRISLQLKKQQLYWIGLFLSTIFAIIIVVVISVLKGRTSWEIGQWVLEVGSVFSAVVTASLTFILFKVWGLISGVVSLQALRTELVINAATRRSEEEARMMQEKAILPAEIVPSDYGKLHRP